MRQSFSDKIVELVDKNPNVYVFSGDHGYALFDKIRKEKPHHFLNAGVAEQNMVGVASGFSKQGMFPIVYGLNAFVPIRVLEQIKLDFCYSELPGLFIGDGAGVVYAQLGASHQSTEDIAVMRALPNIAVLSPADKYEFESCFDWACNQKFPVYLRMGKCDLGVVHQNEKKFEQLLNGVEVIKSSSANVIYATGSMVKVCENLIKKYNLNISLMSISVLKVPGYKFKIDMSHFENIMTVEEHSIIGGLGDFLLNEINDQNLHKKFKKIGINDQYSKYCGTYEYALKEHSLDFDSVLNQIKQFFKL